jgi:hypothetical protein
MPCHKTLRCSQLRVTHDPTGPNLGYNVKALDAARRGSVLPRTIGVRPLVRTDRVSVN